MASENTISYNGRPAQLEAYLQHCQTIEENMNRRLATGRFNLSILTALGAIFGFIMTPESGIEREVFDRTSTLLAVVGILVCLSWVFQILRFREVSRVKHLVATQLEGQLGIEKVALEERMFAKSSTVIEHTLVEIILPGTVMILLVYGIFS